MAHEERVVISAAAIAAGLGAHKSGQGWFARCPAHRDRTPSLHISEGDDGRALVRCHGGCEQAAVIEALRSAGLWSSGTPIELSEQQRETMRQRAAERERETAGKQARAIEIWRSARPIFGTPADSYLRSRGINPDALLYPDCGTHWPETVRWADDAIQDPGFPSRPGLVAAVNDAQTGLVVAVQRIIFDGHGQPLLKDGRKVKVALGPVAGNAFQGSCWPDDRGRWAVAEGVETALAATQLFRFGVWAAINSSNMPNVQPPSWARDAVIFADHDTSGAGLRAAAATLASLRAMPQIKTARVLMAPQVGADANDVLREVAHAC